jgi:hypothetical protein
VRTVAGLEQGVDAAWSIVNTRAELAGYSQGAW